jgi:hypothetical protein
MARKCGHDEGQRQDVSGRKESSRILALHPETALLTFWDTYSPGVLIDAAKLCWRSYEHGGWPMAQGGAAILIRG